MKRRDRLAGFALVVAVAVLALCLAEFVPLLPAAPMALGLGFLGGLLSRQRSNTGAGAEWAAGRALRTGVMLLGAQLNLTLVLQQGAEAILLIAVLLLLVFATIWFVGHFVGLPPRFRLLLAAGIGICGTSAIVAVAPILRASRTEVATALAIVTVFGTAAVVVYPLVATTFSLSAADYGLWAGLAVSDTGQVVAAGFAAGPASGEAAIVTKLTRNVFLGPVALGLAVVSARFGVRETPTIPFLVAVPPFVIGFVGLAALRSVGLITDPMAQVLAVVGGFAILAGLAGIGHGLREASFDRADLRALAVGFVVMVGLSVAALAAALSL